MKIKLAAWVLVSCLPAVGFAAEPLVEVSRYTYDQTLDVQEVVSIKTSAPETRCGVVEKQMTYKDSQGQERTVIYESVATGLGCQNG